MTLELTATSTVKAYALVRQQRSVVLTANVTVAAAPVSGSEGDSLSSDGLGGVTLTDTAGNDIYDTNGVEEGGQVTANVTLDGLDTQREQDVSVQIYLTIYDREGRMVSLNTWEADLSDAGSVFSHLIDIPEGIEIGSIKLLLLRGDMTPAANASSIG